jgi:1,4-alpha-glucan branching enzyme
MSGALSVVLHAHLPFVRHPEHPDFLEEQWFFEAVTECYIPLLQVLSGWERDKVRGSIAFTLSPTLCAMLSDSLLQERLRRHFDRLIDLGDAEVHRTRFEPALHELALFYYHRLTGIRDFYEAAGGDLVRVFRSLRETGRIEIITCAATHALLPFLVHPPSLRAQVMVAREDYERRFGVAPRGIWLPECAYTDGLDPVLTEAGLRWFILDTQGLLDADPPPRYGVFAPVITPGGMAAFGRDYPSAKQVWSRDEGYPGDPWYRDFYRDIGFDLDLDYLEPHLPAHPRRTFTGIKYHRITGGNQPKQPYNRQAALGRVAEHARHFLQARRRQFERLSKLMPHPIIVCPYDAELFGHWWFEGPEFLDALARAATDLPDIELLTPTGYLKRWPTHQVCNPATSSWGEQGFFRVWLNENNHWIIPQLDRAQRKMTDLVGRHGRSEAASLILRQLGRELLLAQASDWPFILRAGTSPEYAMRRVKTHLNRFWELAHQLEQGNIDQTHLARCESQDNIFPDLNYKWWASGLS